MPGLASLNVCVHLSLQRAPRRVRIPRAPSAPAIVTAAVLAVPASAQAAFFPAEVVDGSPDVVSVGDVDLSRDGNGLVGYLRNDGGAKHAFVARFVDGAFRGS
jgi:hypothetical protein